jgi:hypothetical protein
MESFVERQDAWKRSRAGPPQDGRRRRVTGRASAGRCGRAPPKEKDRGQAERRETIGWAEVALVLVLVERQARARVVAIHEARIGLEVREACARCGVAQRANRNARGRAGHGNPVAGSAASYR